MPSVYYCLFTYHIIPFSCRYELHQWLVTLHETMEQFNKRKEEEKEKKARRRSARQRANSASDTVSTSTAASTYPRRKPTRKAPPVPLAKRTNEEISEQEQVINNQNAPEDDPSNLEAIMANLMASTQELQAAMEYSMTEEEPHTSLMNSPEPPATPSTPTKPPTATSSSSSSTPVPNSQEGTSYTPEVPVNGEEKRSQERLTASLDDLTEQSSIQVSSNTGSGKRKSTKKRVGSMKAMRRSVSPPNVPPPPPPSVEQEQNEQIVPSQADTVDGPAVGGESPPRVVNKQKYLKVMDSYTDIGDELNQIATELSLNENSPPKPKPPTPARTSSLHHEEPASKQSSEVGDYLDEAFNHQDNDDAFNGERSESMEVLLDSSHAERTGIQGKEDEGSPGILRKGKERTGERGQVTFQDTTQTYEPRIDQEFIPTSVAAAKMKLFGEKDATRFSRSVVQNRNQALNTNNNNGDQSNASVENSPTLPTLSNADDLLHSIESALQTTSYMEHQKLTDGVEENTYESPWDNKAVARFGLAGSGDRGGVSFSADLGRKGRSLERKRRSAGSPQPRTTTPTGTTPPTTSQSVENILARSSTFSAGSQSLPRHSHRSVSMASDLERQQLQQWLRREQNGFPASGKKHAPPVAPKKTPSNFNTLPNWSQLKSSNTQVSYNASMQSTVYRSLV